MTTPNGRKPTYAARPPSRGLAPGDSSLAVALEVLIHGPLSRTEIAQRLDLSQASLTRLTAPLLEAGLLVEVGQRNDGKAGRPSRPLDVAPDSHHFIGVKLSGERVLGAVTDLRANVVATAERELSNHDPDEVADVITSLVEELSASVVKVTAVGVGLGGLIGDRSHVLRAPFLGWTDVPLGPMLHQRTGLPTVVDNDLVALTEAEHWFGAGQGLERFAVLTIGAAVGYGAVIHNRIVLSDDFGLGLIGHWPLQSHGPACPEGHQGCAHALLAIASIVNLVSAAHDVPLSYEQCLDLAQDNDPVARRIIDESGHALGCLVAAIGNLIMPEVVIIGGEGNRLATVAADAVQEGLRRNRNPLATAIELRVLEGDAMQWCRGAAVLAIQAHVLTEARKRSGTQRWDAESRWA